MRYLALPLFFLLNSLVAQQGPNGASTAVTSGSTSYNWSNATNTLVDNSSAATATIIGQGNTTNILRLTNFGFSIPSGATINGILVEIRMQGTNGRTRDQIIQLRKASGIVGNNKARLRANWPRQLARYIRFGGSSDLWGTTWTHTDINNSAFGIDIAAKARRNTALARVEYVRITVFYNQTNYYSKSTGSLSTLATWGTNTNGTGTAPTNFTNNAQVFNLRNRASYTLVNNLAISGNGSKLVVGDGSSAINFTIPSGFTYTGLSDVSNNATLTLSNTTVPTLGTISRLSNGGTSTIIYAASGSQSIEGRAFHNLTISGTGTKTIAGTASAEEKLTINTGATFSDAGYIFIVEGDIDNTGTHLSGVDGMILMNGSSAQNIGGINGTFGNLEIDNASGVTLNTNVTITEELTLTEGILAIGSHTLTLDGTTTSLTGTISGGTNSNLSINGTGSLGTLNFTSGSQSLNNLTLNRSAGDITLGTPLNVRTTLTMTSGNILNGSNILTLGTSTSSRGTLSRTSGTIVGIFTRWFASATNTGATGLFPVGTSTDYRPAQIEFTGAPSAGGRLTAEFREGDPGGLGLPLLESAVDINKAGESGIWNIAATSLTGGTYTGTFTATNFIGVMDYTTLHLVKRTNNASSWTLNGTHQSTTGSNSIPVLRRTGMSSFGEYAVSGDAATNPLPVELLFFHFIGEENESQLHWATATEINNDHFEISKSANGLDWVSIGRIEGNGNSNEQIDYFFEIQFQSTDMYYQLSQIDYDGKFERFPILFVPLQGINTFKKVQFSPNAVKSGGLIQISGLAPNEYIENVTLISTEGKKITKSMETLTVGLFRSPELISGVYLLIVKTNMSVYKLRLKVE